MKNRDWYHHDTVSDMKEMVNRSAEKYGRRDAFLFKTGPESIGRKSYIDLLEDVNALGTALLNMGLFGKHIAIIGENSYEWVVTYMAVMGGLGIVLPVDKELGDDEIVNCLNYCDADAVVCSGTFAPIIASRFDQLPRVSVYVCIHEAEGRFFSFESLIAQGRKRIEEGDLRYLKLKVDPDALCEILTTSGTTGKSKAVMLSQRNILTTTMGAFSAIRVKRSTFSVLPINHTYECSCNILGSIFAGVPLSFNDSLKYLQKNLQLFKPEMTVVVPLILETLYKKLVDGLKQTGYLKKFEKTVAVSNRLLRFGIDLRKVLFRPIREAFGGNLELIICGGAPLRADIVKKFRDIGIEIINGYGISECAPLVTVNRDIYHDDTSVGIVIPNVEIRIDSPDESGEGEIFVRGTNVMLGYYKDEEQTKAAFDGEWFKTGDLGRLGEDGFLRITGRKKNTIILANGKNVQPEEIEEYISVQIPYIKDVVVCTAGDGCASEYISAIVVLDMEYVKRYQIDNPEKALNDDIHRVNQKLPSYKQVTGVRIQDFDFEKTSTKKIRRYKITGGEMSYVGEN